MTSITSAISAYRSAVDPMASFESGFGGASDGIVTTPGSDFSSMLQNAARTTIDGAKDAEMSSLSAVAGKADIREVVAAVSNAELALETVVNVRDKVISAYSEILRMSI